MRKSRRTIVFPALILVLLIPVKAYQQGVKIRPGTNVVMKGSPFLVIKGGHFSNDGLYAMAGETSSRRATQQAYQ